MRIDYTVQIWKEGSQFVAQAMPIDVVSSGSTPDQARAALDEAVRLFLSTAQEMGTLREVLEECSYEFRPGGHAATRGDPSLRRSPGFDHQEQPEDSQSHSRRVLPSFGIGVGLAPRGRDRLS